MELPKVHVVTIRFSTPVGDVFEQTIFDSDLGKLVKTITKYALTLSLENYDVHGSMVESVDKYWERTADVGEETPNGYTIH